MTHALLIETWTVCGVESGELLMDEARTKHGSAHHPRWNWLCWNSLPGVSAEDGIVEFVEELCLHFGLFDDNTQIRLQGVNLAAELTIGKEHFRVGC